MPLYEPEIIVQDYNFDLSLAMRLRRVAGEHPLTVLRSWTLLDFIHMLSRDGSGSVGDHVPT